MTTKRLWCTIVLTHALLLLPVSAISEQMTSRSTPSDTAMAAEPKEAPSPVRGIRGKLSAADLLSAESILESFRTKHGEAGAYVNGLGWLARGALLMGEPEKARRYSNGVRAVYTQRTADGVELGDDHDLEIGLGAAIEVEAQLLASERGVEAAVEHLQANLSEIPGSVAFRSRLNKRINLLSMAGTPAPELEVEDFLGDQPPSLSTLRGKPVVVFVWNPRCGDCKAQAPSLAHLKKLYGARNLQLVTLTRFYGEESEHTMEKARADSIWKDVYADVGTVPMVISTASMERYGGSSTPTYVFIDRDGIVRDYEPYRLTEDEFDKRIEAILN